MWSGRIGAVRRALVQGSIKSAVTTSRFLPAAAIRGLAQSAGLAATHCPLAQRLQTNMELGLGKRCLRPRVAARYFQRFSSHAAHSLLIYKRGLAASGIADHYRLGDSVCHLDEAVAWGRGVVVTIPHLFGYEIGLGILNSHHRVVMLVRKALAGKATIKKRWYDALHIETVIHPPDPSSLFTLIRCQEFVRRGACLGVTPDLVAGPQDGVAVTMCGRVIPMKPGAFAVAALAQAPIVAVFFHWRHDHVELVFSKPVEFKPCRGRTEFRRQLQEAMQAWCREFEAYLRRHPENWMFWLDKRWDLLLRSQSPWRKKAQS